MPNDTTVVQGSIEVTDRRTHVLGECDAWTPWIEGGGAGLTADTWDVSALAADTLVAIEIDAYSIPDRFQIRYADLYVLWDSGWRGSGAGASTEVVLEATRIEPSWDEMQVYVNGSESGTAWQYRLNCQAP
jgi:hypothetical protein